MISVGFSFSKAQGQEHKSFEGIWEVPTVGGPFWGVLITRIPVDWGPIWGPFFWKFQFSPQRRRKVPEDRQGLLPSQPRLESGSAGMRPTLEGVTPKGVMVRVPKRGHGPCT